MSTKSQAQSIYNLSKFIKKDNFLPIYFFFGEDTFSIEQAVKAVEKAVKPMLSSDFDREVINTKERTVVELSDIASAFPFGSDKKLIIAKDFDELKGDKKSFAAYVKDPSPSTILITTKLGKITNLDTEPFRTLCEKEFIFEAKELKGNDLINWVQRYAVTKGKTISSENATLIEDIVGENRSLIEMQMQKIFSFMGDEKEITYEMIVKISSNLKEYTIFDLFNAITNRNKSQALDVMYNIFEKRKEDPQRNAIFIISMLNKYFTGLAQIPEMEKNGIAEKDKARVIGTHPFYYKNYLKASVYFRDEKLINIARALYEADLKIKTTSFDLKSVLTILLGEIFRN